MMGNYHVRFGNRLLVARLVSKFLLYSLDEISNPELTLKILGHQWYWSYEMSDFNSCSDTHNLKYSSYMLTNESLKENSSIGFFRNLETNKRVVLPTNTHLRLLITAVDVLHSWTIPSFGVKVDACPGRLNQANLFIKRFGVFFGQCSEICGVNHGFMPIVLLAVPSVQYHCAEFGPFKPWNIFVILLFIYYLLNTTVRSFPLNQTTPIRSFSTRVKPSFLVFSFFSIVKRNPTWTSLHCGAGNSGNSANLNPVLF